ncbi:MULTISPECIES: UDP-glucose/GDP-mannose dehydrogenase family protein [unclassified Cryobacterium]|uniref:UDP-glucose dehydrogenase family protein n=1 Tax=unclassified Cryobacterium TaxID=2649013 RepID=UPI002AB48BE7|nr:MULTISPECIES: UDP-glucose/GDP-mannose dehydrogenase family protein [unclassified Cryobacterium]MDY7541189.1 UDP-glucose/GDP-mannose dehydrogenase family protein [Cryobacterium sp. 5B3]
MTVIGTGYLGAVHAAAMAELGHDVLGVDSDPAKIAALAAGRAPFFEPGLPELLIRNVQAGRLSFTTSLEEAATFADIHFVCVGTPQLPGSHAADMVHVNAVIAGLAPHLDRPCLIVGKSTVPVGTTARLADLVAELAPVGVQAQVAWNPEFLREGFAVEDTLRPDRIVAGTSSHEADAILREVYADILATGTPYITTDAATAELVKVSANAFLATKISFINAIAQVCDAAGADVLTLADALGHDARIGRRFLSPGLGFGGGCLGKDIRAFQARADELGVGEALAFLDDVDAINLNGRSRIVNLAAELLGGSAAGKRIAILGAAFKPNSDDVRDSPALHVAEQLRLAGATVRVHDPEAQANAHRAYPHFEYATSLADVFDDADLTLHLTEWGVYRELDPSAVINSARTPLIIDARHTLDPKRWQDAGWTVRAIGRPALGGAEVADLAVTL